MIKKRLAVVFLMLNIAFLVCLSGCGNNPAKLYSAGKEAMEAGDYDLAHQKFTECGDYEDAPEKAREATYKQGLALLEQKKYANAIELFSALGTYQDSESFLLDAKNGQRYESYDSSGDFDASQAEDILQDVFYRTWYWEDDSTFVIDKNGISGHPYQVLSLISTSSDSDGYSAEFRFLDSDFTIQLDTMAYYYTPYILGITVTNVSDVTSYPELSNHLDEFAAEFDSDEVDAQVQAFQEEEQERLTPKYSDETITSLASERTRSYLNGLYGFRDSLLSTFNVKSSYVEYDSYDQVYTCYLDCTYSTSQDLASVLYGFSEGTLYQGVFQYKDTGSDLVLIGYNIY